MKRIAKIFMLLLAGALTFSSCVRKDFDAPPDTSSYDPNLTVTHTIKQLRWLNGRYNTTSGGDSTLITEEVVVSGIVTANDRSGNLYKQLLIEDSTGGIMLSIDVNNIYNDFPVGRKVYVKAKGLYLGYDGGLPILGMKPAEGIAPAGISAAAMSKHLVKANTGNTVSPKAVTLAQVRNADSNLYNRLITITEAEFADTTATYTTPIATTNRDIRDCNGNTLVVRSSNYSTFAAYRVPSGRGSITGVYTVFISGTRATPQLVIRDTSDVKFNGPRCGSGPVTQAPMISIDSLRRLYPGSGTVTLPAVRITGVVISDIDKKNVSTGNIILQDASRKGVILYIAGSTAFKLGDSLVVDVSSGRLELYQGALELTGVTAAKVTKAGTGKTVTPTTLTVAQLNAGFANYESTLVRINNATLTGATYGAANNMLNDGTGTIQLFTSSSALFATQATFGATPKTYVGIVTPFIPNGSTTVTKEIKLRDPAIDVF